MERCRFISDQEIFPFPLSFRLRYFSSPPFPVPPFRRTFSNNPSCQLTPTVRVPFFPDLLEYVEYRFPPRQNSKVLPFRIFPETEPYPLLSAARFPSLSMETLGVFPLPGLDLYTHQIEITTPFCRSVPPLPPSFSQGGYTSPPALPGGCTVNTCFPFCGEKRWRASLLPK